MKNIFGFRPGNISLYKLAFLHKSAGYETGIGIMVNNERLEFLGDAILDAVVADFLFKKFPTRDEGFLTEMRSKIVSRVQLNKLSQKLGIDELIKLDSNSNGQYRSYGGDAFEALIGAIFLDKGYLFTRKILLNRIIDHYFDLGVLENQELNYKSKIIEWAQKERKQLQFKVIDEVGSGYRKQYIVAVVVNGKVVAQSQHYSIKGAEQLSAEKAWMQIPQSERD
ncbi:MAG: ribonuclease III [Bacteroidetes bacterium]|nr:ribonuclease III [Bacteroidota bacterium]